MRGVFSAGVLAGCLWGLTACGGAGDFDEAQTFDDEQVGSLAEALTTLPNNWDPVCGDVSVRTRGTAPVTLFVSPTGNDAASGAAAAPLATLAGAQNRITQLATTDYTVIVKGGEYRGQTVVWEKFAPNAHIHIKAADGETPVFDGYYPGETSSRLHTFFQLAPPDELANVNVTIEGLTIKHYVQVGIYIAARCARIYNNKLQEMGDKYANCRNPVTNSSHYIINGPFPGCNGDANDPAGCCATVEPLDSTNPKFQDGCWCQGTGAIDLTAATHNLLKHNDITDYRAKPGRASGGLMHGFYLSARPNVGGSTFNRIEDNYVRACDGSAVKVRGNSDDNVFLNNYFERVSGSCFNNNGSNDVDARNALSGNVCTFWYHTQPELDAGDILSLTRFTSPTGSTSIADNPAYYYGTVQGAAPNLTYTPDPSQSTGSYVQLANNPFDSSSATLDEVVTATAVADVVGTDGKPEVFVALYYPSLDYTKVVYTDGGNSALRTIAYTSTGWKVNALTAIRPAGAANDQIIGAFYLAASDRTQVWVGKASSDGRYDLNGGTKLLDSSGAAGWKVNALTAGKFAGDTNDQLITAAVISGVQQIWRGDGRTAQSGSLAPGVAATSLYSSPKWRVTAMTNGVITGGTNSLITGFHWVASSTVLNRIYLGDGVGAASTTTILDTTKLVTALTVGKLGGTTPRLVSGFDTSGTGEVYLWTGTTMASTALYSNPVWHITSLAAGKVDSTTNDQLITSLDLPGRTEVDWADGTTGILNGGKLYVFP